MRWRRYRRWLRPLPWIAVGLLGAGATLLALAPAAWLAPRCAALTGGHVELVEPRGSVWHGSATLVLAAGGHAESAALLPGRIEWDTAFWPLFAGRLQMRMRHSEAMPEPVEVDVTRLGATLSAGRLTVPASLLTGLGAPFNTLALEGGVTLDWSAWRVFGRRTFGQLGVTLDGMSSRVSRVRPLGSYRVVFEALGDGGRLSLSTTRGPLLLDGSGTLNDGAFSFRGTARAEPAAREALLGLLNLLGRPAGGDGYVLMLDR